MSDDDKIVQLGSVRSEKTFNSADWTPVELLRDLLGKIEKGELDVEALVVCFKNKDAGVSYLNAVPNGIMIHGILRIAEMKMMRDAGLT